MNEELNLEADDMEDPDEDWGGTVVPISNKGSKFNRTTQKQERMRQAFELRKAGVSYDDIATRLGYKSRAGAYNAVKSVLDQVTQETSKELQTLHSERLNTMLMVAYRNAQQGDLRAIDTVLRIMERQAVMTGIDAPRETVTAHHVLFVGGDEGDYIASLQEAANNQAALESGPLPDEIEDAVLVEEDDE